jgi:hypothetical protein
VRWKFTFSVYIYVLAFFIFFFVGGGGIGVLAQGLTFASQALLPLEPLHQPFFVIGFSKYGLTNYLPRADFKPRSS